MAEATMADVLVIGGGVAGVGAGAFIAADARVVVLEREAAIGYHATSRSAAVYIRNYGNATLRALNASAEPFLTEPEGVSDRSLLSPRGQLMIAREDETSALDAYLDGASGIARIAPEDAVALFPILRREGLAAAAHEPAASDIDVDRLLQGLARLLRVRGGLIVTGAAVGALARSGGAWRAETRQGVFEAPVVVNAAGAWADTVAALAGLRPVGLTPYRRSAAILPAPDGFNVSRWPLIVSAAETFYAKPEAGRLMVSPADEDAVEPHDAWPDEMVLAEGLHRYEQAVTTPVTRVERSWAGLRTFAPDRTPVVGFSAAAEGFFWLAGQGGYGVQTAPALSRLAADLVAGRAAALPETVVRALDPARLAAPGPGRAA
ncbi:NAD(P)/FAD-dependent oxidoreductase [Rubrimonas cliftonensis]|uniref:D-arginine dehydrogenase n=1 Tax=Rubrimonas cliftonensis TaxID=89524 RepID=A0A1H4EEW2_9RHOB|nr:FAD-binding oxidoreductase [Rubrimonas cliftonensis]SEA83319.1 D-arginine dehydrogenase [Rubrimonas cliftonensis]